MDDQRINTTKNWGKLDRCNNHILHSTYLQSTNDNDLDQQGAPNSDPYTASEPPHCIYILQALPTCPVTTPVPAAATSTAANLLGFVSCPNISDGLLCDLQNTVLL
ncbi:hypothetical protein PIB30_012767 [Stylosanthes scabra]|uniref:Uncharacterized protein n=1 Tax=Stylosanthes scabra TaxID=79078 RepID=A0ABU6S6H2_9FABA|nr:hypothetical protein [Stylosanthes scabra]